MRCCRVFLLIAGICVPAGCHRRSGRTAGAQPFEVVSESGIEMIYLPGGEFLMGTNDGNDDERPPHKVKISPFLIDKCEVTQEMLAKLQLTNPSRWKNPKRPVEQIRWRDAKEYCNERSRAEKLTPCYNEKTME